MTKEKWSKGKTGGCVVSDTPNRHEREGSVDYYGGYLVAESIPDEKYVSVISRSLAMLALLEKALPIIEAEADQRDSVPGTPSHNRLGYWQEMRDLASEIGAEIDRAYGREGKSDG